MFLFGAFFQLNMGLMSGTTYYQIACRFDNPRDHRQSEGIGCLTGCAPGAWTCLRPWPSAPPTHRFSPRFELEADHPPEEGNRSSSATRNRLSLHAFGFRSKRKKKRTVAWQLTNTHGTLEHGEYRTLRRALSPCVLVVVEAGRATPAPQHLLLGGVK
jgi:hypothetical protein